MPSQQQSGIPSPAAEHLSGDFQLDPQHIALIRHMQVIWLPVETGAPVVHPLQPLGDGNTKEIAAAITGLSETEAVNKLTEACLGLKLFLKLVAMAPDHYTLPSFMQPIFGGPNFGVASDGGFTFTDEHLLLLQKGLLWRVSTAHELPEILAMDMWPVIFPDGKRPYGDYTYYQIEMAELLDRPYTIGPDKHVLPDPSKDAALEALHEQTLPAMQLLLMHGTI